MANYNLVVDSKFQPFSFERYIQPYQLYAEAYEKRQEAYDKLAEDSSKWGEQLDPSSQAYSMWKSFQDEITQAADDLSSQGLTIGNRKALSNVRKSYGQKIKAIEEADKRMQAQAALRQQMQAKDSSIEYKSGLKIDDFLHGGQGSNESLSGATMRAETADMASKLGQSIYSNPSFSKVMGGSYWQIAQANGYSPDVLGYIRSGEWRNLPHGKNASDADNKLYNDIKQVADLYTSQINRTKGYSQDAQARLGEQIFQGLYSGLEKPKYDFQRNMDYMSAAERDASARGWQGLTLEKAAQDERQREFNLSYQLDLPKAATSGKDKGKGEDILMSNKPVYINALGTSLIDAKDSQGNQKNLENAVKLERPLQNLHRHPNLMKVLANISGVNLKNKNITNSDIWNKLKSDVMPYYDIYYNGNIDNIDSDSEDLILELRPKTTKVPDYGQSWSGYQEPKNNQKPAKKVIQTSTAKPKPTTTNNTDSSDPNSPLNAFPTN